MCFQCYKGSKSRHGELPRDIESVGFIDATQM